LKREWQTAVERGDAAALAEMLAQGENVDSRDRYGQTALAEDLGRAEIADLLNWDG
jgi:ankyrin repeat protein